MATLRRCATTIGSTGLGLSLLRQGRLGPHEVRTIILARILALCDDSGRKQKRPNAEASGRQLRWLRGLEATYTEHVSITPETPENRSKSWARNHLYRTRFLWAARPRA
jgi:hypothetical protein